MFSLNSLTCRLIHSSRVLQVSTAACNLFSSRRGDPSNMSTFMLVHSGTFSSRVQENQEKDCLTDSQVS